VWLVFARAAAIRVDLRELLEQRLHLLPPAGRGWPDPPPGELAYRRVRAKAGRIGRSVGAPGVLLTAPGLEPAVHRMSPRGSAKVLALARLSEGRVTAATVASAESAVTAAVQVCGTCLAAGSRTARVRGPVAVVGEGSSSLQSASCAASRISPASIAAFSSEAAEAEQVAQALGPAAGAAAVS